MADVNVQGVGRYTDDENPEQAAKVVLLFLTRSPTDEELRLIHEAMRLAMPGINGADIIVAERRRELH